MSELKLSSSPPSLPRPRTVKPDEAAWPGLGERRQAVLAPERALGRLVCLLDERSRQARQRPHGLGHARQPQEVADADVQDLAPPRDPEQVQPSRLRLEGLERTVEVLLDVQARPRSFEDLRFGEPVEPGGMADKDLGHEAAGPEGLGQDLDGPGMGPEMREESESAAPCLDEALEVVEGSVRIGGVGEAAEQRSSSGRIPASRPRAAGSAAIACKLWSAAAGSRNP